jgi:hypothetical protein
MLIIRSYFADNNTLGEGGREMMATDKQTEYYTALCVKLGQEPDDDFENLSISEASNAISELAEMVNDKA